MWESRLKRLIQILEESGVNELEARFLWQKFRVTKEGTGTVVSQSESKTVSFEEEPVEQESVSIETPAPSNINGGVELNSPMVGTFYRASSPETPPFVSEGDHVSQGQTLCIIEAMKIMNEIEAEQTGTINRILVENEQPVEYDQPLFLIVPD
tara:strand:- start:12212 stop:12670 length:459 start_codon:yes stop_codon:yes gene_type:complete